MLKLWGEVRGVMGRGGDKCGVAVLGIWGSRKWVAGERGAPSEIRGGDGEHGTPNAIRETRGCAAPDGVLLDPRSPQTPNVIRDARGHMAFGAPCAICAVHGSAAPADVRRDLRRPWMHGVQSAQHDSQQLKYALWLLLV